MEDASKAPEAEEDEKIVAQSTLEAPSKVLEAATTPAPLASLPAEEDKNEASDGEDEHSKMTMSLVPTKRTSTQL